ncbi:hypothetical protein SD457_20290 [Coprobacillaceae bacterium CR2/5/TPMF4]|nr:hypothetical protein SD457_20290 [Coprobacillaceae bacterium CR2/5/TPMF4]
MSINFKKWTSNAITIFKKDIHIEKVKELKEKYKDQITIYQGFEAEYFEEYLDYYQELLDSGEIDYLILGNHFDKYSVATKYYGKPAISDKEIISYKDNVLKALDTDLFTYIAHPDLFMIGKIYFDEFCENITREICQKALEKDVPLEINAGGIRRGYRRVNDELLYPYPNSHFFDIVSEMDCKVILGIDGHSPDHFNQDDFEALERFAWRHDLNVIEQPVFKKGRLSNKYLSENWILFLCIGFKVSQDVVKYIESKDKIGGEFMARECIHKYLEEHQSNYQGKYRCHSCVQTKNLSISFTIIFVIFNFVKLMFL